ncbi:unnamed protein product [Hymenolepis diminuta]|uniref:Uncharacterized protein n=1 Tax=Hymenolepis diminuta TaxID=6216 RepID=A0A564Z5W9_HYMDI|nr:unnamed protein product [Hymenolepis diminuta]
MIKLLVIAALIIIFQVPESKADILGYYLQYFGLRDIYIPYINGDIEKIKQYREEKQKAREGLRMHFEKQRRRKHGEL